MAKIMNYTITERRKIEVEVFTEKDEKLVISMNREMNRTSRKERRHRKRNVSADYLYEEFEYEFTSDDESILDVLIKEEEKRLIRQAVDSLPPKQKFVIIEYFWKNKSLRDIARENNLHLSTVAESYHSAMAKLGVMLKELQD